ncbi:MAG: SDR family NAD(P)-dependent oxidoreductase, partial [Spirochaeta sp.]|nr:SDR family NAD(P)-dependent oxidoreductase [Spirochaeta sp.]
YVEHRAAEPEVVVLPAGDRWVRTHAAPQRTATGAHVTPEEIAGGVRGRVAVVTGAAQGFGLEIARGLASLGAVVALADLNVEGARERAAELGAPHAAFAVNVTDEESVRALIDAVAREYGGIDVVVSNAGVLKAGSVKELELKDFRFVTDVNYIGFFLMTKHASPVMALQAEGAAAANAASGTDAMSRSAPYLTDIIEINSKSGLVGSNKNAAYAGSKFGGIGLVQSFALELVEQGTKVNAVCPGNYLDGPLWSDPERGLFVQYLRAGKVPGATTIEEVRHFYEGKVPMKRGCTGADVVRAIAYVVGQQYETGQAVPVTGGQVMLA